MKIEKINISEITEYENNAKLHAREQIEQIKKSINEFGNNDPIAIDENNVIIEGHGRYKALQELGFGEVEVIRLSHMSEEQKRAYILVHNKLTMNSDFDIDILQLELDDIDDIDMSDFGFEPEDNFKTTEQKLKENDYSGSLVDDFIIMPQSIFDTRQGIWQNRKRQWLDLGIKICDDSKNVDQYIQDESADLIFACPPYFDLEVYSDNENDISNMGYDEFCEIYSDILRKFARKLKNNRFAIVTISDVRDKKGFYRDLTGVTKRAFESAGVMFYNDIVLINTLGSGAMRARKQMNSGRKVIRSHQSVLVFFKGDPKNIKQEFGELAALENLEDDEENQD